MSKLNTYPDILDETVGTVGASSSLLGNLVSATATATATATAVLLINGALTGKANAQDIPYSPYLGGHSIAVGQPYYGPSYGARFAGSYFAPLRRDYFSPPPANYVAYQSFGANPATGTFPQSVPVERYNPRHYGSNHIRTLNQAPIRIIPLNPGYSAPRINYGTPPGVWANTAKSGFRLGIDFPRGAR